MGLEVINPVDKTDLFFTGPQPRVDDYTLEDYEDDDYDDPDYYVNRIPDGYDEGLYDE